MFEDVSKLIDDVKNVRVAEALRDAARIQLKVADFIDAFTGGEKMAFSDADLDKAISECEGCAKERSAALPADVDPKKIDPATLALILSSIIELLKFLREWRKKRQEG